MVRIAALALFALIIVACGGTPEQPTPMATTAAAPTPTTSSSPITSTRAEVQSRGLGLDRDVWERDHVPGSVEYGYQTYDTWKYWVVYTDDLISHLELNFDEPYPTLETALDEAAKLIPVDSVFIRTYSPEGMPDLVVSLYSSEYLRERFPADAFIEAEPGEFIMIAADAEGGVSRVVLALGNHP